MSTQFNTSTMSKEDLIVLLDKATEINIDIRAERQEMEKRWNDCIDILRELPTNSPFIEKARKLYSDWCDYYQAIYDAELATKK